MLRLRFVHTLPHFPPEQLLPVTLFGSPARLRLTEYATYQSSHMIQQPLISSFQQYINHLPSYERIVIGHIQTLQIWELRNLIDNISTGSFAIGSDGSVKGSNASYATCIQDTNIIPIFFLITVSTYCQVIFHC